MRRANLSAMSSRPVPIYTLYAPHKRDHDSIAIVAVSHEETNVRDVARVRPLLPRGQDAHL